MIELGYFALGFVLGVVFAFASLISIGRWVKRIVEPEHPMPPAQPQSIRRKDLGMWDK